MSLRCELKHRIPPPSPRNRTWALNLTGKTDLSGRQHVLLGLVDHGTRACLTLETLSNKRSLTILRTLVVAFRAYGLRRRLRVDNEPCLNSRLIRPALELLGVHLQPTEPHSPWQNGRIECFFGTLMQRLDGIAVADAPDLTLKLQAFRVWYNHVRPHQHLYGRTPAEAWAGRGRAGGRRARTIRCVGGAPDGLALPLLRNQQAVPDPRMPVVRGRSWATDLPTQS